MAPIERFRIAIDGHLYLRDEALVLKVHASSADRHKPARIERVVRMPNGASVPLALVGGYAVTALRELLAGGPVPYMLQGYAAELNSPLSRGGLS